MLKIIMLGLILLIYSSTTYAAQPFSVVLLKFNNNTPYTEMKIEEIFQDLLLEQLTNLDNVILMERSAIDDSMENQVVGEKMSISKAIDTSDFSYILSISENDITSKKQGENISATYAKAIGEKHHAEYLLHGTINYLGQSEKRIILPLSELKFDSSTPKVEANVTVRIIRAYDGRIIWNRDFNSVSTERFFKFNELGYGSADFNNKMFIEVLEKISKKAVKELKEDLITKNMIG